MCVCAHAALHCTTLPTLNPKPQTLNAVWPWRRGGTMDTSELHKAMAWLGYGLTKEARDVGWSATETVPSEIRFGASEKIGVPSWGSLLSGDPTTWGSIFGGPLYFRKPPLFRDV